MSEANPWSVIQLVAERRIEEAQSQGLFDNLPGAGKPLELEDLSHVPEDMRMAYKILRNAGCLPPELEERKEINRLEDIPGLKIRIAGIGGEILARMGAIPQQIAGTDIYPSLEKGTIDAAEWIGPYDDQKLGFNKVAKYYYYPGFWEGGPQISMYINIKQWNALPKEYQTILEDACLYAHAEMQARYDAKNPTALKQLIGSGTQLRPFPNDVMAAAYKAAHELYDETAAKNPKFKKIYDQWRKFRDDQLQWFAVAENRFDNFMQAARSAAAKSAKQ